MVIDADRDLMQDPEKTMRSFCSFSGAVWSRVWALVQARVQVRVGVRARVWARARVRARAGA